MTKDSYLDFYSYRFYHSTFLIFHFFFYIFQLLTFNPDTCFKLIIFPIRGILRLSRKLLIDFLSISLITLTHLYFFRIINFYFLDFNISYYKKNKKNIKFNFIS